MIIKKKGRKRRQIVEVKEEMKTETAGKHSGENKERKNKVKE